MSQAPRRPAPANEEPLFLDSLHPAFAPGCDKPAPAHATRVSTRVLAELIRERLAAIYRMPGDAIRLIGTIEHVRDHVAGLTTGPVVTFPPSASATTFATIDGMEVIAIARGWSGEATVDAATAADLPSAAIAWIESPSDPLGGLAAVADVVRLARACHAVVVDERLAQSAGQSLLPLAGEFENVVVLRSVLGPSDLKPVGWWAAGAPRALSRLALEETLPPAVAAEMAAALSERDNRGTAARVRAERSRLFRMLRKFSFTEPIRSWGPFIPVRIDLLSRERFVAELANRGIYVHRPAEEGLERFVRIAVGTRAATDRLQAALREMAPLVLSQEIRTPPGQCE
jgi:histidinol-phosphate/aromatic aminotransferase/cobyric acid decarboxylase-like protein